MNESIIDHWFLENLVCPKTQEKLALEGNYLVSSCGRRYPIVDGTPVMLLDDEEQTMGVANASLASANQVANGQSSPYGLFVETLGINENARDELLKFVNEGKGVIDPVVTFMVGATNGIAYQHLIGNLSTYPFPEIRLPLANNKVLLDIGCNWGRWSVSAARKGYMVVGMDPSLGAVLAAKRVARNLGLDIKYVVADARFLPFRNETIDVAFSYSVFQHFSRGNAEKAISEIGRVLKQRGKSLVQMPSKFGIRCLYHQLRRGFREAKNFEVRYWTIPALRKVFLKSIGATGFSVDCFFGIGLQGSDIYLMPLTHKAAILASEALRKLSHFLGPLVYLADSVYVSSVKN